MPDESEEMQVRVECDDVTLKLTLSAKMQKKPFHAAVLTPFLKAYSTKTNADPVKTLDDIVSVHVDQEYLKDLELPANIVMIGRGVRDVEVYLKDPEEEARKERKKAAEKAEEERLAKEAEDAKEELEKGCRVEIHDLAGERYRKLNGREARLVEWVEEKGRWNCKLNDDDDDFMVALKPANLRRPVDAKVEIFGLTSDQGKALNGLRGKVIGYSVNRGRYDVEVPGRASTLAIRPRYLKRFCPPQELDDQTRVAIEGVQSESHKHMNGKEATILSFDGDRERYELAIELVAKHFNVKQQNLRILNAMELAPSVARRLKFRKTQAKDLTKELDRSFRADMVLDQPQKVIRGVHSLMTELDRISHDIENANTRLDGFGAVAAELSLLDDERQMWREQLAATKKELDEKVMPVAQKLKDTLDRQHNPVVDDDPNAPGNRSIDDIWEEVVRTTNKQEQEKKEKEEAEFEAEAVEEGRKAREAEEKARLEAKRENERKAELGLEPLEID